MFGGGTSNPYDDIVCKTTDENLTSENWELIMNLCDKVIEEGQDGARNVIAAVLKRLAHRNPNVQLYALSLAESLSKNCTIELHREIASRAFTQGLEKLIADRTTHDKVRSRALGLVAMWTAEFENDPSLGVMQDCYDNLKAKNYNLSPPPEPLPPTVDDEIRRKEEEELQRVLEMSMQDKGGRGQWADYGASSSSSTAPAPATAAPSTSGHGNGIYTAPRYASGYVPAQAQPHRREERSPSPTTPMGRLSLDSSSSPTLPSSSSSSSSPSGIVTRVRALHTFTPTEPGELPFEKGDIIKVVDRGYKDWWRGQLKGRTGIFPVNYVQPLPEPTPAEIAAEAQAEFEIFSKTGDIERLLTLLRNWEKKSAEEDGGGGGGLADDEEVQELYRASMALRPKIVKLIDKYSQKRADLVSMNETFVRARTIFDRMMEESLARHTGVYEQQPTFGYPRQPSYGYQQPYGGASGRYPGAGPGAYPAGPGAGPASQYPPPQAYGPQTQPQPQPQPHATPQQQPGYAPQPQPQPTPQPQAQYAGYPGPQQQQQPGTPSGGYGSPQPQPQPQPAAYGQPGYIAPQPQPQPQAQAQQPGEYAQPGYGRYSAQGPNLYPAQGQNQEASKSQDDVSVGAQSQLVQQQQPVQQPGQQVQSQLVQQQPQPQPVQQTQPVQQQSQPIQQSQPVQQQPPVQQKQQAQPQSPSQQGPPYIFDPTATYADPNVQAWAQYYAKGGKELAGAVYFVAIPGVTDQQPAPVVVAQPQPQSQAQPHPEPARSQSIDSLPLPSGYQDPASQPQSQPQLHSPGYQLRDGPAPGPHGQGYQLRDEPLTPSHGQGFQLRDEPHGYQLRDEPASLSRSNTAGSTQQQQGSPLAGGGATPSWVLPKKGQVSSLA